MIRKLNENLDWTSDLGDAFVSQPQDVANVHPGSSRAGGEGRRAQDDAAADGRPQDGGHAGDHLHRARKPRGHLRPDLRPPGRVRARRPERGWHLARLRHGHRGGRNRLEQLLELGRGHRVPAGVAGLSSVAPALSRVAAGRAAASGWVRPPGNINIGNDINIGGGGINIGNGNNLVGNSKPWRPDPDRYRPGQGTKPGLARPENRPAGGTAGQRPGPGNGLARPGEGVARPGEGVARPGGGELQRPGEGPGGGLGGALGGAAVGGAVGGALGGSLARPRPGDGSGVQRPGGGDGAAGRPGGADRPQTRPAVPDRPQARPSAPERPQTRPAPQQRPQTRPAPRPSGLDRIDSGPGAAAFGNRGASSLGQIKRPPGGGGGGGMARPAPGGAGARIGGGGGGGGARMAPGGGGGARAGGGGGRRR